MGIRSFVGRVTRPLRQAVATRRTTLKSRDELHDYWRDPPDASNKPAAYAADGPERAAYLQRLLDPHVDHDARVVEIGCNVGRNLAHLWSAGYRNLAAVEISQEAVDEMRRRYPDVRADITVAPVEAAIGGLAPADAMYSVAVLEHLHSDSDGVFADMARLAPVIVTIEDEHAVSDRHVARNYREVFEGHGMTQVFEERCGPKADLPGGFMARVFLRRTG
jgi:SAM-dependent methyltransferase